MTVKELKEFLNKFKDEQEIVCKSAVGIEWEIITKDEFYSLEKYKNKPKIYVRVQ